MQKLQKKKKNGRRVSFPPPKIRALTVMNVILWGVRYCGNKTDTFALAPSSSQIRGYLSPITGVLASPRLCIRCVYYGTGVYFAVHTDHRHVRYVVPIAALPGKIPNARRRPFMWTRILGWRTGRGGINKGGDVMRLLAFRRASKRERRNRGSKRVQGLLAL